MSARKVGRMLKALREARGLTQEELARKARVTRPYITMLETGAKNNPSLATLKRIAKGLKVPIEELMR